MGVTDRFCFGLVMGYIQNKKALSETAVDLDGVNLFLE